jgi:protein-glutamine gamma-glutamyltransferase
MRIGKVNNLKKVIAQLLLLAVPTFVFVCYLLFQLNNFYSILDNAWLKQGLYFAGGLSISVVFYSYRFRFITTASLIVLVNYLLYKFLGDLNIGEFDAFYFSVQFLIFSILFCAGWFAGFGFARSRTFTIAWSAVLLIAVIVILSKTTEVKVITLINAFVPALAYTFYIIYTAELIRNMNEKENRFSWFIIKRMSGFALVCLIFFFMIFNLFKSEFLAIEQEWGESKAQQEQKGNSESMTEEDKNGGVSNKDQTRLTGSLNKDKQLVFVARLDNFFDNGRIPNPLYFTSHYYTKFDTATQTFETDESMPYNDLFNPDPSQIPLYFTASDSNMIKNSLGNSNRKVVSAEIYKVALAASEYLAPSTAFYCQPISVPREYREQYKSAYRAKMWVSELNSAYFIYNPAGNYMLEQFQQWRFEKLRTIKKIKGPDKSFMDYYTYMPKDVEYKKIIQLSEELTKDAFTPIDKVIAIRDYFLSKDELNQPLFAYSDNPGVPGIPSANKLTYFLLENRKGYCAYYAGATLFMLRALGIPSRIAAGYLTEDRSNKNPGWYWFYQDQAHAWVQVYFQNFGWIDFDTTVPDVNTQQAAQPDGTPPEEIPEIFLVAEGLVSNVDTISKRASMITRKIIFHEKEYTSGSNSDLLMDVSLAAISTDTGDVKLSVLKKNMRITAVSHAAALKDIRSEPFDSLLQVIERFPKPVPIDEIKIISEEKEKKPDAEKDKKKDEGISLLRKLKIAIIFLACLIVFFFLTPLFIWLYLHSAAKKRPDNMYSVYRASLYYLTQMGFSPIEKSPAEYAHSVDLKFGTTFTEFNRVHQKQKYSTLPLTEQEKNFSAMFYLNFIRRIKQVMPMKTRLVAFLNIYNTFHFFSKPKK